jgi:hypothetical protein
LSKNYSGLYRRLKALKALNFLYIPLLFYGGGKRARTADPLLAKQVLFQLSYTPEYFYLPDLTKSLLGGPR